MQEQGKPIAETAPAGTPPGPALAEGAKLIQAATAVEETRFNNLNSRGIALLSATSLVTALAGLFSKDILDRTKLGDATTGVSILLLLTVVSLVVVAITVVWKVLVPSRRFTFGNNEITNDPTKLADANAVHAVTFTEYLAIHSSLVQRNREKASALHFAYWFFLSTVAIIAISVGIVAIKAM